MSTTGEMRKFRALLCAKWNEIITKFCRNVLRDTCHGVMIRFNVKHLAIKRACDNDCIACSAGGFWRGEWIYIPIGCSGRHLEIEKQWRVGAT